MQFRPDRIALPVARSHDTHHAGPRAVAAAIGEDGGVRWTIAAAAGSTLVAALLVSACGAARAVQATAASPASADRCYSFAVAALRQHVVVGRRPAACAGLTQAQVNQVVGRAIRTVVGPHPKAVERRLAAADSRYLGKLVRPVPPPSAASVATGLPTASGQLSVRLAALAAWLATAIPGAYLLTGLLARDARRRVIRKPGVPSAVPIVHAALAMTGLLIWIAFTVTRASALAWADVGVTWVIAGLGMATLLAASPEQRVIGTRTQGAALARVTETSTAPFPTRAPVIAIALHGTLATLTILLVLVSAVGIG